MTTGISCPKCGQWVARATRPPRSATRRPKRSQRPGFQIATLLPDYRKLLLTLPEIAELDRKDAAGLFDCFLANLLRQANDDGFSLALCEGSTSWHNGTLIKFSRKSNETLVKIKS